MDPFQQFLELKPRIEQDHAFMSRLQAYNSMSFEECVSRRSFQYLGEGQGNICFSLGYSNGFWWATRESKMSRRGSPQQELCDDYISKMVAAYEKGNSVPQVCGGVVTRLADGDGRFILLVEDLSACRTADFVAAPEGREYGYRDGKKVHYDFDEWVYVLGKTCQYMRDGSMIDLR